MTHLTETGRGVKPGTIWHRCVAGIGCGLLLAGVMAPSGFGQPYTVNGKQFPTIDQALVYQRAAAVEEIQAVPRGRHYGGSLMVNVPPDGILVGTMFITSEGRLSATQKEFFIRYFKTDADLLVEALNRSGLFDSVTRTQVAGHLRHAADYGYRYVLHYRGKEGFALTDVVTGRDEAFPAAGGLANMAYVVENILAKFSTQPGGVLVTTVPAEADDLVEAMAYDEATRRGWVAVKGKGLQARQGVLRRIAEICATKNKLLISDDLASSGAFKVLDEELKDGVLKIAFEALY